MNILRRVYSFYRDGFAGMTVGRSLWILILIKVVVLFLVLKLFFFPDFVDEKSRSTGDTPDAVVRTEMLDRSTAPR